MPADVILKYGPLIPGGAEVKVQGEPVHVGLQGDYVYIWARKNTDEVGPWKWISFVATGEDYIGEYFGTVVYPNGLVFHAIEVR